MKEKHSNITTFETDLRDLLIANYKLLKAENWQNTHRYQDNGVEDEQLSEELVLFSVEADVSLEELCFLSKERRKCPKCNEEYNEQVDVTGQFAICHRCREHSDESRITEWQ